MVWCAAEPGPFQTLAFGTVPDQRSTAPQELRAAPHPGQEKTAEARPRLRRPGGISAERRRKADAGRKRPGAAGPAIFQSNAEVGRQRRSWRAAHVKSLGRLS